MIQQELKERGCAHVDRFPPFFNIFVGCHLLNQFNQEYRIYYENTVLANLRLHGLLMAPRGYSKTFWLSQYLRGEQAILNDTGIPVVFKMEMTAAAFVGTIKFVDGEPVRQKGIAEKFTDAIIGIEEFSAITDAMKQQYGRALDTALLNALDSGYVYKDLAPGEISYRTGLTLFAGTQPTRLEMAGGLDRRFIWMEFIPTAEDRKLLKIMRRKGRGKRYNPVRTKKIRDALRELPRAIAGIEKISFSEELDEFFDRVGINHFEEAMYERMIMGYKVMRGRFDSELYLDIDPEIERLIRTEMRWRDSIRRGPELAEVIAILRDNGGIMSRFALKDELLRFGHTWSESKRTIDQMIAMRIIQFGQGDTVVLRESLRQRKSRKNS